MNVLIILRLFSTIVTIMAIMACARVVQNPAPLFEPGTAPLSSSAQEYRIQAGDLLDIKFFYNSELNEQVHVRPDGRISLQLAPEIMAAGVTPAALTEQLRNKYAAVIKTPEIVVMVKSFSNQRVYVDGEVMKPGVIALTDPTTVMQAISQVGGFKDSARKNEVIVVRRAADGKAVSTVIDVEKIIDGTEMRQDIALLPYDVVYVPKSAISDVNVWIDQYIRKNIPVNIGAGYYFDAQ